MNNENDLLTCNVTNYSNLENTYDDIEIALEIMSNQLNGINMFHLTSNKFI